MVYECLGGWAVQPQDAPTYIHPNELIACGTLGKALWMIQQRVKRQDKREADIAAKMKEQATAANNLTKVA